MNNEDKYVYVMYDTLYEKVICVHDKENMSCPYCSKIKKECREKYHLVEEKKLIVVNDERS